MLARTGASFGAAALRVYGEASPFSKPRRAAGLDRPERVPVHLLGGAPGRALAATARRDGATLVVVSESVRRLPKRALFGSATGHLVRRCRHPSLSAPANPAAAMRLRQALAPAVTTQAWRS